MPNRRVGRGGAQGARAPPHLIKRSAQSDQILYETAKYKHSKRVEIKERKWTAVQVGITNYIIDIFRFFHIFLSILLF